MALDAEAASRAVYDVFSGAKPLLSGEEMQAVVQRVQKAAFDKRKLLAEANQKTGETFLAENKGKHGVSGTSPSAADEVEVHYEGRLVNGKVFDSSIQRGKSVTFAVNKVIKGWTQALQLMQEGERWQIYIPAKLAYAENGAGGSIGPNETLIFDIELLKVK